MTWLRGAELALYGLLSLLPYLLLFLTAFRHHLRFSPAVTAVSVGILVLLRMGAGLYAYYDTQRLHPSPDMLVYVLLSLLFVKAHFGKILFTTLMLSNIASFVVVAAKSAEGLLFPDLALELHRWSNCLTMLGVEALVLIPLLFYIKRIYRTALEQEAPASAWRYLWLVPLTFFAVWYRNNYFSAEGFAVLALRPRHTVFSFVVNAGALLIYTMVAELINEHARNEQLREREFQLSMQHTQYSKLTERIEEARRAKHDLRQHLHVIHAYLEDRKYDQLEVYLQRYEASLPEERALSYCDNYAVNALLQYFAGQARAIGADYTVAVQLPEDAGIPDEALTVVLGNLLENAVEACATQEQGSHIRVRGKADESAVFFKIVNTCPKPPKADRSGRYLSTKHPDRGIGLRSVNNIAEQHHGMMKASWGGGEFAVSVLLHKTEAFPHCES